MTRAQCANRSSGPVMNVGKKRVTPVALHHRQHAPDVVDRYLRRVEVDAAEAIDLNVDEAGEFDPHDAPVSRTLLTPSSPTSHETSAKVSR